MSFPAKPVATAATSVAGCGSPDGVVKCVYQRDDQHVRPGGASRLLGRRHERCALAPTLRCGWHPLRSNKPERAGAMGRRQGLAAWLAGDGVFGSVSVCGLPGFAGFGLEVVRTGTPPATNGRTWVEVRGETALVRRPFAPSRVPIVREG